MDEIVFSSVFTYSMTADVFAVNLVHFCFIWSYIYLSKSLELEKTWIFSARRDTFDVDCLHVCVSVSMCIHTQHTLTSNKRYLSGSFTLWRSDYERLNH